VTTWIGGIAFLLFWFAAGIAIAFEWIAVTRSEPRALLCAVAGAALAALFVGYHLNLGYPALIAIAVVALLATAFIADGAGRSWALAALPCAAVVAIVPVIIRDRPEFGAGVVLWMFAVVWATDVAAYFTGRYFGGPKLCPSISPKKTWSGFLGGLIAATLGGTLVAYLAPASGLPFGLAAVALASALASVASQLGDLAESALKRRFGAKDSGRLIPGHGGVMDRLDGFAAVALLCGLALAGSRLAR
jgi:phosphatidate cytidylyltransferase